MTEPRTLIVGDTHGWYDRLAALLIQEEIIHPETMGRINDDVRVVHVGDLGNFSDDSLTRDQICFDAADNWFDEILWGNHDYSAVTRRMRFKGYGEPANETRIWIRDLQRKGKLVLATSAHGFLITHAGLHPHYGAIFEDDPDPKRIAGFLNEALKEGDGDILAQLWLSVGHSRGGRKGDVGGLLWRDISEPIWEGVRQVFGHSADRDGVVRTVGDPNSPSYAIDIGAKNHSRQAGIWLPEEKIVRVDERQINDLYYGG